MMESGMKYPWKQVLKNIDLKKKSYNGLMLFMKTKSFRIICGTVYMSSKKIYFLY